MLHIIRAALRKFIQLEDTPNSYSGLAGKLFKVNSSEDALEASTNTDSEIAEAVNVAANVIEKVAEVEVSSDCDYVEFTGLDGNSAWFYILFFTIKNSSGSDTGYRTYVNGDTENTNYYVQNIIGNGSSISSARGNSAEIGYVAAGERLSIEATITKDPDGYFRVYSKQNRYIGSNVQVDIRAVCKTATITNITSLRVQSSVADAIGAGSKFILFKARRG